ncbi:MAG: DUF1579 domain-containing protein [Phycisphaerales bacterium]|nr:DUF1579 domain-containing protein [Phycisphaerales bacterium]
MNNFNRARFVFAFSIATILIASIVFTRASIAVASAQTSQPAPPQQMSVATAHQLLQRLIGAWNISGEAVSPTGKVEKRLQGRAVWQWALGGVFLFGDTVLNNGAAAIQEIDTIGFNSGGQFFQRTLLTDQDQSMIWQRGSFNSTGSQLTFQSLNASPTQTDAPRSITSLVDFSQTNQISWTMLYSESGTTVGTVRLVLTRAPADQLVGGGSGIGGMNAQGTTDSMNAQGAGGMGGGAQQSPSDPAALQAQLNQMVAAKQQMQKQIDGYKAQVTAAQASFQQLNQP